MLDPLTALSLASNIVQFLSFTGELIDRGREIYNSADGILVEHAELEIITRNLNALTSRLLFIGSAHEQPVDIHRVWPSKPQKSSQSTAKSQSTEETLTELVQGCRGTSRQLVDALRELKLEGANKRWNSFRQALKSIWEEKKIKDLSERQERYRRQIDTTLLLLLRENITSNNLGFGRSSKNEAGQQLLGFIDGTKKWQAEVLDNLQRNDWKVGNADDLHTFSSQLSAAVKGERDNVLTSKILAKLRFQSMEDRHATIPEAHTKTFEWVFSRDISQSNQPSNLSQANCDSYLHWLQGGESLYWITGKPGSGKSTLMKFLCDDGRTDHSLRLWAGDSPLRTASFFFWNSGTTMQMSRLGLLQSLLYALIGDRNCLIPHLFPDRWKYYELFGGDSRLWSWSELSSAFATLLEDQSTKYFIFIDGLDEVDNDPLGIAEFVHRISRSGLNIKICASSRPWNVFEDTFKRIPSLRMEELTRLDIFKYVSDILNSNELFIKLLEFEPFEAQGLATRITGKANGVFLWVRIVVRSLLDGLRDGDKITDLHDRLQRLPEDLDDLFRKILDHVDTDHRTQTSRLFQLIQAAQESLTLLTLDLAEDGLEKAIQAEFGTMPSEKVKFRADNMRRRLNSRCQLLLEAPSYKTDGAHAKVSYLHRTVKDFILQPDMWNFIISSADPNFNAHLALVGAFLHRIKTLDPDSGDFLSALGHAGRNCLSSFGAIQNKGGRVDFSILFLLDHAANRWMKTESPSGIPWKQRLKSRVHFAESFHWTVTCTETTSASSCLSESFRDYASRVQMISFADVGQTFRVAAEAGNLELFKWLWKQSEQLTFPDESEWMPYCSTIEFRMRLISLRNQYSTANESEMKQREKLLPKREGFWRKTRSKLYNIPN